MEIICQNSIFFSKIHLKNEILFYLFGQKQFFLLFTFAIIIIFFFENQQKYSTSETTNILSFLFQIITKNYPDALNIEIKKNII